jgi:hypothetical protein
MGKRWHNTKGVERELQSQNRLALGQRAIRDMTANDARRLFAAVLALAGDSRDQVIQVLP